MTYKIFLNQKKKSIFDQKFFFFFETYLTPIFFFFIYSKSIFWEGGQIFLWPSGAQESVQTLDVLIFWSFLGLWMSKKD